MTINRGTEKEDGVTRLGSHNFLMVDVHVAHDCMLGDRIMIANSTMLGRPRPRRVARDHLGRRGRAPLRDDRRLQLHRRPVADLPRRAAVHARRRQSVEGPLHQRRRPEAATGSSPRRSTALHEAHRLIYRAKMSVRHAAEILESHGHLTPEVQSLLEFIEAQQEGKHGRGAGTLEEADA